MTEKGRWGRWQLDEEEPMRLMIWATPYYQYDIEVSRCQTVEAQERWLEHMSEKNWITTIDLADLRRAFEDLGLARKVAEGTPMATSKRCLEDRE